MNYYAVIPSFVLLSKELTGEEKIVCGLIAGLSEKNGYCYANNQKLASFLGKTENATQAIIKRLYSKGILSNLGTKFERKLKLNYIVSTDEIKSQIDFLEDNFSMTKSQIDTRKSQIDFSTNIYIKDNKTIVQKNSDDIDFFDNWWKIYPRKIRKETAKKAWKKVKPTEQQKIIKLTELFAEDMEKLNRSPEHILHPATYLNQKAYLDYEEELEKKPTKEGAEFLEDSIAKILTNKIKKTLELYVSLDEQGKESLNKRAFADFKTKDGGRFFSDEELALLAQTQGTLKDFFELEIIDGEIYRMLKGYTC